MSRKDRPAPKQKSRSAEVRLDPVFQAKFDQALADHQAGRLAEAELLYKEILRFYPGHADSVHLFGMIAHQAGRPDLAEKILEEAIRLRGDDYMFYTNYGVVLKNVGKVEEAVTTFRRAIALKPDGADAHWGLGQAALVSGDFNEGWREFEWRWKVHDDHRLEPGLEHLAGPLWDGRDLAGQTLLIYCEQGLGDSIQFIRYAKSLRNTAGRIIVLCQDPLCQLFKSAPDVDEIVAIGAPLPSYDVRIPMLSLPGRSKTTLDTIPADIPYLTADPAAANQWRQRLAQYPGKKIGIVWRGNPRHSNDRNRSLSAAMVSRIFAGTQGIALVVLQKDARPEELAALEAGGICVNAAPDFDDFADTAAALVNLDLVITVDTSICHLAGALGVKVWTLLPFAPDWRWLLNRRDTPWYRTMTLFRQPKLGDWDSVVEMVKAALVNEKG